MSTLFPKEDQDAVGTDLALPDQTALMPLFETENGFDPLIEQIEKAVRSFASDVSTAKGREAIKAMAFKVTKSKTALQAMAKDAKEDAAKKVKAVNSETKRIEVRLDALRDETRKPLSDWEAEKERAMQVLADVMSSVSFKTFPADVTSDNIKSEMARIEVIVIDPALHGAAEVERVETLAAMNASLQVHLEREADQRELAELRAAQERQNAEAQRLADEAAAKERATAAALEAERQKAAQAEREKVQAEQDAQSERAAAEFRQKQTLEAHQRELVEAEKKAEAAIVAERERVAQEQAEKDIQEAAIAASGQRRQEVEHLIVVAIVNTAKDGLIDADSVCHALMTGQIPNVKVML